MNYETANQILILLHESIASKHTNLHHPIFLFSLSSHGQDLGLLSHSSLHKQIYMSTHL